MIRGLILDFFGVFTADFGHNWVERSSLSEDVQRQLAQLATDKDLGNISVQEYYRGFASLTGLSYESAERIEYARDKADLALVHYVVTSLKPRYKLYLASNASHEYIYEILDSIKITDAFERIFVSSDMHLIKPQSAFYEKVLSEVGLPAPELLFVDDRVANIEGAERAGMRGYHYQGFAEFKDFIESV